MGAGGEGGVVDTTIGFDVFVLQQRPEMGKQESQNVWVCLVVVIVVTVKLVWVLHFYGMDEQRCRYLVT